jgi:2-polyprenyl-3-methyl-5-hydroxy-6-metoxy-1,4-benzoquinol methylase
MLKPRSTNERIEDYIAALVSGKKVLDVGCVDHVAQKETETTWLHRHLAESASSIVGLDILQDDVCQLAAKGYRMVCGDAMTVDLRDHFDVIVAGELIEHVDNPGQFIANMRRHLRHDGMLVLTTPNPFYALHFLEFAVSSPYKRWNPQHVAWFCFFTVENLLSRHGMYLKECIYFARSRKIRKLLRFLHLPCPKMLASTMLAIAKPLTTADEVLSSLGSFSA